MPVPSTLADLNTTAASNYPTGGESVGSNLDDYLRAHAAFIAQLNANKQDADSDLTSIAALAPSNDDIIQRKAGAWTNRTISQLKTDLAYGTASGYNVGTSANNVVQLDGSAKLPAVDGSQLTNIGSGLGIGQTRQDVTASRALGGGPYTNSTGKPIYVTVIAYTSGGSTLNRALNLIAGGVTICQSSLYTPGGNIVQTVQGVVLPGESYYANDSGTQVTQTLSSWVEIR